MNLNLPISLSSRFIHSTELFNVLVIVRAIFKSDFAGEGAGRFEGLLETIGQAIPIFLVLLLSQLLPIVIGLLVFDDEGLV